MIWWVTEKHQVFQDLPESKEDRRPRSLKKFTARRWPKDQVTRRSDQMTGIKLAMPDQVSESCA